MTRSAGQLATTARPRRVILLGSTGSIGTQTLEVIERLNAMPPEAGAPRFEMVGLASRRNAALLSEQARRFNVRAVALAEGDCTIPGARRGHRAAESLVREVDADLVVSAMVGIAGLAPTLAAVDAGRDVALANKETLVAAGAIVVPLARRKGAAIRPIDSEHAALWQCLLSGAMAHDPADVVPPRLDAARVRRAIITASGGPFRQWPRERIERAEPAEALRHPTWSMGPKVTIDSASLMNKALELIEAHWLFGLDAERLGVLVHPRSLTHAIVEFVDGSAVAQLAPPDMRVPIQRSLTFPTIVAGAGRSVLPELGAIELEAPDLERFPALTLGERVIRAGGLAGAILNGANEAAVEAYLAGRTSFGSIARLTRDALDHAPPSFGPVTLERVLDADAWARDDVRRRTG